MAYGHSQLFFVYVKGTVVPFIRQHFVYGSSVSFTVRYNQAELLTKTFCLVLRSTFISTSAQAS